MTGGGSGGDDQVVPPARRWGAAAPLQDFGPSAAAAPCPTRPVRWASCPTGAGWRILCGINNVGSITGLLRRTVAKQYSEFYRRHGEEERPFVEGHPMGSRVAFTTATPGPR